MENLLNVRGEKLPPKKFIFAGFLSAGLCFEKN
jgi:hypothetical protein